jgi:hypothetical protein
MQLGERDVPDFHRSRSRQADRQGGPHSEPQSEVPFPVMMEPHLIVEFYSR